MSGTLDERLYAQQDANWNVTTITNASAAVQERFAYASYSTPLFLTPMFSSSSQLFDWTHLFASMPINNTQPHYLGRNRYYSSLTATWLSRDIIKLPGTSNLYDYVALNPLLYSDPYGLAPIEYWQERFLENYMPLLTRKLPGKYAQDRTLWADTLDAGCIGVSMLLLGYPAYNNGQLIPERGASFENCYSESDIAKAKERVIEMTEKNECCRQGGFNIYGGQPRAQLIAVHWSNDAGNERKRVVIEKDPNGKINANKYRDTLFKKSPRTGFNFDFFYYDELSDSWLHANHQDNIRGPRGGSMRIFERSQKEFEAKIKAQQEAKIFDTILYCAVCEQEWTSEGPPWKPRKER